jgi:hypothetical protein
MERSSCLISFQVVIVPSENKIPFLCVVFVMKHMLIISALLISALAFGQSPSYLDKVEELLESGKEGKVVAVKGEIVSSEDEGTLQLRDESGTILLDLSKIQQNKYTIGDMVTVNGKLKGVSVDSPVISVSSLRKNSYVKDPSHCCMPVLD